MQELIIPHNYTHLVTVAIPGKPPRKSNRRVIAQRGKGGRPMLIKSAEARQYVDDFIRLTPISAKQKFGSLEEPLALAVVTAYPSWRSDISVELLMDCLEQAEVISNDRYIRAVIAYAFIDKDNPRSELRLYRIEGYDRSEQPQYFIGAQS